MGALTRQLTSQELSKRCVFVVMIGRRFFLWENPAVHKYLTGVVFLKISWKRLQGDIIGGITAAVVALPLSLAFGIASGAGAEAGLYASIFGGLTAALFGGCGVQITGPTGAMIGVLVAIVSQYGVGGMLLAGVLAGLMQIVFGLFRFGKFVKYLPQPVIAGFTNGVSILFFMTAIDDARKTLSITVITALSIVLAIRFLKKVPESLFGLTVGIIANELFIKSPHVVGTLSLRAPKLAFDIMPLGNIGHLIIPAFTICLLGSISALLSAEVTDEMVGARHDSNKELIGQGLGNIVSSLLGGLPVSGAVARSGVNVHSGGRTRLSGILHSIFLLILVLILGPIVRRIPLASLAAILMIASLRTADWKSLKLMSRARWSYGAIMTVTTVLTVIRDLTIAVAVGVVLSGIFALAELASSPRVKTIGEKIIESSVSSFHPDVDIIAFHGPLFFTGVEHMRRCVSEASEKPILVFDFSDVAFIDETGALAVKDLACRLKAEGKRVYIGGLSRKPLRILMRMGVVDNLGRNCVYKSLNRAVKRVSDEATQAEPFEHVLVPRENA